MGDGVERSIKTEELPASRPASQNIDTPIAPPRVKHDDAASDLRYGGSSTSTLEDEFNRQSTHEKGRRTTAIQTSKVLRAIWWFLADQWFIICLGILIAISSQVQVPLSQQQTKETVAVYLAVSIIFFVTGCTLPTRTLIENYSKWKIHLFVQVQCFLMTSAIMYGIVSACATNKHFMDPWLLIGLIVASCTPTTISSNVVMTRTANGNTALTVVQSTIGNFLGPFVMPGLIKMYLSSNAWYTDVLPAEAGGYGEIYRRVFKQLGLSLFLPMAVGQVVQNVFPKTTEKVFKKWKLNKIGSFCLLTVLWSAYDQAFATKAFSSVPANNIVFIVFISIGLFVIWWVIAFFTAVLWLGRKDVVSVCYCVPAKTPAMGIPIIITLWVGLLDIEQSKLQLPMVIYQGFQITAGSILTIFFRRWVARGKEMEKGKGQKGEVSADIA